MWRERNKIEKEGRKRKDRIIYDGKERKKER